MVLEDWPVSASARPDRFTTVGTWRGPFGPTDPDAFRAYVRASGAEFSVAQGVYVGTRCGWFSDRTTRYLASGKPALVQDTGFGESLPNDEGVVAFRTIEEAVAGAADIVARYPAHSAAARRIAEEHFDSDRVLARFCEQATSGAVPPALNDLKPVLTKSRAG